MVLLSVLLSACIAIVSPVTTNAQADPPSPRPAVAETMTEDELIRRIRGFQKTLDRQSGSVVPVDFRAILWQESIAKVDELLRRFPKTPYMDDAKAAKLTALAALARRNDAYLSELLEVTARNAKAALNGRLASENAFYSIQAFVLGARREQMPESQRLAGTKERYRAFLSDFPNSERVPVIRASLVRNLIALDDLDRAREEFAELERDHGDHRATKRARGELYRVDAIGKPLAFERTTADGEAIRTKDYLGKVVVLHFWATWSAASLGDLPRLVKLNREAKDRGLQLVGVNVDKDRNRIGAALDKFDMTWPQYFDEKGFASDALVSMGVITIPTYFVVDRQGILRGMSGGADLTELVERLLAESSGGG